MRNLFTTDKKVTCLPERCARRSIYDAIDLIKCCEGRTSYGGPSEASVKNQIALASAQVDAWEANNA